MQISRRLQLNPLPGVCHVTKPHVIHGTPEMDIELIAINPNWHPINTVQPYFAANRKWYPSFRHLFKRQKVLR